MPQRKETGVVRIHLIELLIVFCFVVFECLFEGIFPLGLSWTRSFLFEMSYLFILYLKASEEEDRRGLA